MDEFIKLARSQQTIQKLLQMLACFGLRFRLCFQDQTYFPQELLEALVRQQQASLSHVCTIQAAKAEVSSHDWLVFVSPSPAHSAQGTPFCTIEDLLSWERVISWLESHPDLHMTLELQAEARQSPLLSLYYQAVLETVPPHVELARLPVWLAVLEELFSGLLVSQSTCEISLATIHAWMGVLAASYRVSRWDHKDLDDGEAGWEPTRGAEVSASPTGSA